MYTNAYWCSSGSCLRFRTVVSNPVVTSGRNADLSAYSSGSLSFDYTSYYYTGVTNQEVGKGLVTVVSNGNIYTLGTIPAGTYAVNIQSGSLKYNIPAAYLTSDFRLRFQAYEPPDGTTGWTEMFIDNVLITCTKENSPPSPPSAGPPPTAYPTRYPTPFPTPYPTKHPTWPQPTQYPTRFPTRYPTRYPTPYPRSSGSGSGD